MIIDTRRTGWHRGLGESRRWLRSSALRQSGSSRLCHRCARSAPIIAVAADSFSSVFRWSAHSAAAVCSYTTATVQSARPPRFDAAAYEADSRHGRRYPAAVPTLERWPVRLSRRHLHLCRPNRGRVPGHRSGQGALSGSCPHRRLKPAISRRCSADDRVDPVGRFIFARRKAPTVLCGRCAQ